MAMMLLTVVDVVGRYVFNSPVPGAFEATEVMLALSIFAGLPIVTARGDHVTVRLLVDRAPQRVRFVVDRVVELAVALLLAGAAYLLYERGMSLASYGDSTVLLRIPLAPVAFALMGLSAAASLVAAVRFVLQCLAAAR
nr:TRAP transporter small permease [Acuticoccus kalidii]